MKTKLKPQLKTRCCTDRPTSSVCTDCGRVLCAWHSAGSPVQVDDAVVLAPICYPSCEYTRKRVVRRGMGYASTEMAASVMRTLNEVPRE
jgi:hypothetical protein